MANWKIAILFVICCCIIYWSDAKLQSYLGKHPLESELNIIDKEVKLIKAAERKKKKNQKPAKASTPKKKEVIAPAVPTLSIGVDYDESGYSLLYQIDNGLPKMLKGTLEMKVLRGYEVIHTTKKLSVKVKSKGNMKGGIILKKSLPTDFSIKAVLSSNHKTIQKERKMRVTQIVKIQKPLVIDAKFRDWGKAQPSWLDMSNEINTDISPSKWSGVKDLSPAMQLGYDDKYLYFAAKVRDSFRGLNAGDDQNFWQNDCVELLFDLNIRKDLERVAYDKDDYQILFSPKNKSGYSEGRIYCLGRGRSKIELKHVKARAFSDENMYVIEAAILWDELQKGFKPRVKNAIGATFSINDNDTEGKTYKFQWTWVPVTDKRPSATPQAFGLGVFMP